MTTTAITKTATGLPEWLDDAYQTAARDALEAVLEKERKLGARARAGVKPMTGVQRRGDGRFLADLRRWVQKGEGPQQPSIRRPDQKGATDDVLFANEFYSRLTKILADGERSTEGSRFDPLTYTEAYLEAKKTETARGRSRPVAPAQVLAVGKHLELIFTRTSFSEVTDIRTIGPRDITKLAGELRKIPTDDGGTPSPDTVRKRLHALSGLLSYAQREGDVDYNPLHGHRAIPASRPAKEATWLELKEVRALLHALRGMKLSWKARIAYFIAAFMRYTGARLSEVMRARPEDAHPDNLDVIIRSGKSDGQAKRYIPYWPALRAIMREYWVTFKPSGDLLFPGITADGKGETKRTSLMKTLHRAAEIAGFYTRPVFKTTRLPARGRKKWKTVYVYETYTKSDGTTARRRIIEKPESGKRIGHHTGRDTYITIRLGMQRGGKNIDLDTVMRETGHELEETLRGVYAHGLQRRYAMEELDYDYEG